MGRLLLALLVGLVGAAIVHIAVIFAIPTQAMNDSWSRLSRLGPLFSTVRIATVPTDGPPPRRGPAEIVILPCIRREPLVAAAAAKPA